MSSKPTRRKDVLDSIINLKKRQREINGLSRQNFSGLGSSEFGAVSSTGSSGGSGSNGGNNDNDHRIKSMGDTMIGPLAFYPIVKIIASGVLDVGADGGYSSRVIATVQSGSADNIVRISNASYSGQILFIQAVNTTPITLKHYTDEGSAKGNIFIPGNADHIIGSKEIVLLQWDTINVNPAHAASGTEFGQWTLVSGGGSSGANIELSNLGTTSVNANVIPQAGKLLGSDGNEWARVHSNNYRLGTAGTISSTSNDIAGTTAGIVFNVATGDLYDFQVAGSNVGSISASGVVTFPNYTVSQSINLQDTVSYPGANGSIYREGNDVKIFSGGTEINMSSIGSTGANIQLSNLGTTSVNANIIPQAGKILGSSGNEWARVHSNNYRLGTAGTISNSDNDIAGDSGGITFNVPTGAAEVFDWQAGGASKMTLTGGGQLYTSILRATTVVQLDDSTSYPGSNGAIYREGNDVKIFTGGTEVNMSSIGGAGATTALNNLTTTSINQSLIPSSTNSKSLGSASLQWQNLFIDGIARIDSLGFGASYSMTLPTTLGTNGQVLTTNGSSALSWTTVSGGSSGASTTLNNLGTTAINASLIPASNLGVSLGSSSKKFNAGYIYQIPSLHLLTMDGTTGGNINMEGGILHFDDDNDTYIESSNDDQMQFFSGGSVRMKVNNSNVLFVTDISMFSGSTINFADTGTPTGSGGYVTVKVGGVTKYIPYYS